jgi:hypothetical protein
VHIDAVIVRTLLVPALVAIMGRWNWWMPMASHAYYGFRHRAERRTPPPRDGRELMAERPLRETYVRRLTREDRRFVAALLAVPIFVAGLVIGRQRYTHDAWAGILVRL